MAGRWGGAGALVVGVASVLLLASAAPVSAGASAAVTAAGAGLTPGGVAEIRGHMPKGKAFKPKRFVLSLDKRFSRDDALLGTKPEAASKRHFRAWVSLPDVITTGKYRLLACRHAKPSKRSCFSVKRVNVRASAPIPVATPTLDTARAKTATIGFQGGSVSVTAADGTTFTLTVPDHSVMSSAVTMTPVTSLAPASAVGTLVDGVMIEPLGAAPAGSTLTISRGAVPPGARAVAFGGVDPSGGAFPLPVKVATSTKIALTAFGGYGVSVPVSGKAAEIKPRTVPCQTRSPTGAGAQPLMNCIAVAQRLRALFAAVDLTKLQTIAELAPVYAAAAQELAGEVSKVTSLPPTDEGDAELQLLLELAIGVQRQAELFGLGSATAALDGALGKALEYHLKKLRSVCMGGAQHSSALYIEYVYEALFDGRTEQLMGLPEQADPILRACFARIKLQLTGNDNATVDNGEWTEHVVGKAVATITGTDQLNLGTDTPSLTFTTATSKADPSLVSEGGTATTTSYSGKMHGETFGIDATRRVRCDKDKKLIVERKAYLWVTLFSLWEDAEAVTITVKGVPLGNFPSAAATQSWLNDYYSKQQKTRLEIDGPEDARSNNGACRTGVACQTFSYDASLKATALQN